MFDHLKRALSGHGKVVEQSVRKSGRHSRKVRTEDEKQRIRKSKDAKRAERNVAKLSVINERDIREIDEQHENLFGIVVPMGCGKTVMAEKYGWIDCDSLVDGKVRAQCYEDGIRKIADGANWSDAFAELHNRMKRTLHLLQPRQASILLVNSLTMAQDLGVRVCGIVFLTKGQHELNMEGRDEAEKALGRINADNVSRADFNDVMAYGVHSNHEIEHYCHMVSTILGIPTGCPGLLGVDDMSYSTEGLQWSMGGDYDLSLVIDAEEKGFVPRQCVDYAVKKQGLGSYRGYGITMNDWAKALSGHDRDTGSQRPQGKVHSIVSESTLADYIDMDGQVVKSILAAHPRDRKFALNLVCHWVDIGQHTGIGHIVSRLYCVRRGAWRRLFERLASVLKLTNYFMGIELLDEERDCLMNMSLLVATGRASVVCALGDSSRNFPASHDVKPLVWQAMEGFERLSANCDHMLISEEYESLGIRSGSVGEVVAACQFNRTDLKTALSRAIPAAIMHHYSDYPDALAVAERAKLRIESKWYRATYVRDEWSDTTSDLYDSEEWPESLVCALAILMTQSEESLRGGFDWSSKVESCLRGLLVQGMVAQRFKAAIALQRVRGVVRPVVCHEDEDEMWVYISKLRLPKHMLNDAKVTNSMAMILLARLAEDQRSRTMRMMSVVNGEEWMPASMGIKSKMALVYNWATTIPREMVLSHKLVAEYFRTWTGHTLTEKRLSRLELYVCGRSKDGGLGVPNREGMVYKLTGLGIKEYSHASDRGWDLRAIETRGRERYERRQDLVDVIHSISEIDFTGVEDVIPSCSPPAYMFGRMGLSMTMLAEYASIKLVLKPTAFQALGEIADSQLQGESYYKNRVTTSQIFEAADARLGNLIMRHKQREMRREAPPKYAKDRGMSELMEAVEDLNALDLGANPDATMYR